MSQVLDVAVFRGREFQSWAAARPVRQMRDGCAGIVYRGAVFPVYANRYEAPSIELDDEALPKEQCPVAADGAQLPFKDAQAETSSIDWHLESNRRGRYLAFKGGEATLESVLSRLDHHGIEPLRHAPSIRRAGNGIMYDWFVQLSSQGAHDDISARIGRALADGAQPPGEDEPDGSGGIWRILPPQLRAEALADGLHQPEAAVLVKWLAERILGFTELAGRQSERIDAAAVEIAEAHARADEARRELAVEQRRRRDESAAAQAQIDKANLGISAGERADRILAHAVAQRRDAEEGWLAAEEKAEALDEALASAQREMAQLKARNAELAAIAGSRGGKVPRDQAEGLAQASVTLMSRLRFDADALARIIDGFPNPRPLFNVLTALERQELVNAKKLHNGGGWMEVDDHIRTGHPGAHHMGRVYYRPAGDNLLHVYVHHKKSNEEQDRVIRRLAGLQYEPAYGDG
jgi:hypothetical protein